MNSLGTEETVLAAIKNAYIFVTKSSDNLFLEEIEVMKRCHLKMECQLKMFTSRGMVFTLRPFGLVRFPKIPKCSRLQFYFSEDCRFYFEVGSNEKKLTFYIFRKI